MNFRKLICYLERRHSALFFGTTTFLCYYGLNITAEEENDEEDQKRQTKDFSEHSKIAPSKVLGKAADEEKHGPSTTQGILGKSARFDHKAQSYDIMLNYGERK